MPGTVKSELFPGAVRKNTNVTGFEDTGKARFPEFILDNGHFITVVSSPPILTIDEPFFITSF